MSPSFARNGNATRETNAALTDVRKASEGLKRILKQGEGNSCEDGVVKQTTLEALEYCTGKLELLKQRILKHGAHMELVLEREASLREQEEEHKAKVSEIDNCIVGASLDRVNILSERDKIVRDILVSKRSIQETVVEDEDQRFDSCEGREMDSSEIWSVSDTDDEGAR